MRQVGAIAVTVLIAVFSTTVRGSTTHHVVPGESIQAAIEAAADGDLILAAPGVYAEYLDFAGKAVTVRGDPCDPCAVILDGTSLPTPYAMVAFISGEGPNSVIEGFTITGGRGVYQREQSYGGGVVISDASPTIRRCRIVGNTVTQHGAGVYCEGASQPVFVDCTFADNAISRPGRRGGGVYANGASLTFTNCRFNGNRAGQGGGICLYNGQARLDDSIFYGNVADGAGGAVYVLNGTLQADRCRFTANSAADQGGGLALVQSKLTLTNAIVHANTAQYGAGINLEACPQPEITHATIVGNIAANAGGGLRCLTGSHAMVRNSILYHNIPEQIRAPSAAPVVTYCNVQGGYAGPGNFADEPGFVPDFDWQDPCQYLSDNAFRLHDPCSPGIDAGDPNYLPPLDLTDFDGGPRYSGAAPDVGVYESRPHRRIHNLAADTWHADLSDAVSALDPCAPATLVVNPGRHYANVIITEPVVIRSIGLHIPGAVAATVIDGSRPDDPCQAATFAIALPDGVRVALAGLTITGGAGTHLEEFDGRGGGAVACLAGETLISNCLITGNDDGLAPLAVLDAASLTLRNTAVFDNHAQRAALLCRGGHADIELTTFHDNTPRAIQASDAAQVHISSSIVWNDEDDLEYPDLLGDDGTAFMTVRHSFIQNGWSGPGHDNRSDNPMFAVLSSEGDQPSDPCEATVRPHAYRLNPLSPVVNRGDPDHAPDLCLVVGKADYDLAGRPRVAHCRVDAGAYEAHDASAFGKPATASTLMRSYCTIQEALDNAPAGTTVNVGPGVYRENLVISKANLTLRSTAPTDPEIVAATIIDGGAGETTADPCDPCGVVAGSAITLAPMLSQNVTITGFTIRNGRGTYNPTASDPNESFRRGGGIFATHNDGVSISRSRIIGNTAELGGGLYFYQCNNVTITECTISENSLDFDSGQSGGGVRFNDCHGVSFTNNLVTGNTATLFSGGIYAMNCSDLTFEFNTFHGNRAFGADGAGQSGAALRCYECADVDARHNIFWGNDPDEVVLGEGENLSVTYCNVAGGYEGLGNIDADPRFVQPGYWDDQGWPDYPYEHVWIAGDYRLQTQAQQRLAPTPSPADLNEDGRVDLRDFARFAEQYLADGENLAADFDASGTVDMVDFLLLAGDFLVVDPGAVWSAHPVTSPCIDAGQPNRNPVPEQGNPAFTKGVNLRVNMGRYGNTAKAAPAPEGFSNIADLNNDGIVDLLDWAELARLYGGPAADNPADLSRNGQNDILDVVIMAENWLWRSNRP